MTQTSATPAGPTSHGAPVFPPGRYGRRRAPHRRRWLTRSILVVVIAATGLLAVKLYKQYGTDEFSPTVVRISAVTDSSITVRFVVAKPGGAAAICTVEAYTVDGGAVGSAQVPVPAGTNVTVDYTLTTTSRPYAAEVPTCHAAG